ncbi:hypothetical protein B5F40_07655 [Gordonibacter sp. An230]|nr:hypothetical protein B5F40_07655 [Gordonibacter sp. An230]
MFVRASYRNARTGALSDLRSRDLAVRMLFEDLSLLHNVDPSRAERLRRRARETLVMAPSLTRNRPR